MIETGSEGTPDASGWHGGTDGEAVDWQHDHAASWPDCAGGETQPDDGLHGGDGWQQRNDGLHSGDGWQQQQGGAAGDGWQGGAGGDLQHDEGLQHEGGAGCEGWQQDDDGWQGCAVHDKTHDDGWQGGDVDELQHRHGDSWQQTDDSWQDGEPQHGYSWKGAAACEYDGSQDGAVGESQHSDGWQSGGDGWQSSGTGDGNTLSAAGQRLLKETTEEVAGVAATVGAMINFAERWTKARELAEAQRHRDAIEQIDAMRAAAAHEWKQREREAGNHPKRRW